MVAIAEQLLAGEVPVEMMLIVPTRDEIEYPTDYSVLCWPMVETMDSSTILKGQVFVIGFRLQLQFLLLSGGGIRWHCSYILEVL